ncbi:MAG: ATP-dependent DNA helicase [Myxococcales bacterium]|nr:ATP-dependent DNA helicase [Myxococcales bacterium]
MISSSVAKSAADSAADGAAGQLTPTATAAPTATVALPAVAALNHLAAIVPYYEVRPGQAELAAAVATAIATGADLLAEAGTGTGKTLAYLLPALLSNRRVLIATATRQLQNQLLRHDLPQAQLACRQAKQIAVLKGRANYVCLHRLQRAAAERHLPIAVTVTELNKIIAFCHTSTTGDRAEVTGVAEDSPLWPLVTSTADTCLGSQCPDYQNCFVVKARRAALQADVVVVNHHLLLAEYALRERWPDGGLLPQFGVLIIDEAHGLADTATAFFGHSLSARRSSEVAAEVAALLGSDHPTGTGLRTPVGHGLSDHAVDSQLRALIRRGLDRLQVTASALWAAVALRPSDQVVHPADLAALRPAAADCDAALATLQALSGDPQLASDPAWQKLGETLYAVRSDLHRCLPQQPTADGHVRWLQVRGAHRALVCRPVEVAADLQRTLLAEPAVRIFTSATLATGGSFAPIARRIGLAQTTVTIQLPSPFDFARQCRLFVPIGMPEPFAPDRELAVVQVLADLAIAAAGGMLALFSSYRALAQAAEPLARALPFVVLVQGQQSKEQLLERFIHDQPAVLLATLGFWQGVDLPAQALRVVALDKIPFPPPDDPLFKARCAAVSAVGLRPFDELSIPAAETVLRQGFGRLIRSSRHRGVVAVLDPRLTQKAYGRQLLQALPPAPIVVHFSQVAQFLADGVGL